MLPIFIKTCYCEYMSLQNLIATHFVQKYNCKAISMYERQFYLTDGLYKKIQHNFVFKRILQDYKMRLWRDISQVPKR